MTDHELMALVKSVDPQAVRLPPGIKAIAVAIEVAEREACAEIADEHEADYSNPASTIASRIRERSNAARTDRAASALAQTATESEMDKVKELLARCKCGVYLTVNEHRDAYETAEQALANARRRECPPEIEPDVVARMIETDTIVGLQFYPDTPVGSHEIWHYDLDAALDMALDCLAKPSLFNRLT